MAYFDNPDNHARWQKELAELKKERLRRQGAASAEPTPMMFENEREAPVHTHSEKEHAAKTDYSQAANGSVSGGSDGTDDSSTAINPEYEYGIKSRSHDFSEENMPLREAITLLELEKDASISRSKTADAFKGEQKRKEQVL